MGFLTNELQAFAKRHESEMRHLREAQNKLYHSASLLQSDIDNHQKQVFSVNTFLLPTEIDALCQHIDENLDACNYCLQKLLEHPHNVFALYDENNSEAPAWFVQKYRAGYTGPWRQYAIPVQQCAAETLMFTRHIKNYLI